MELGSITLQQALEKLEGYWEEVKQAPLIIWKWTETSPMFRGVAIGITVLFAFLAIYLLFALIQGGWKGLFRNLLFMAVGFAAICAVLVVAKREAASYFSPEEIAIMLSDSGATTGSRYSLVRGEAWSRSVDSQWRLVDNTFALPVGEDLIFQISDLGQPDQEMRYYINEILRSKGNAGIRMLMNYRAPARDNPNQTAFLFSMLDLWVIPDHELSDMPWYGAPGTVTPDTALVGDAGAYGNYHVLENDGETLILAITTPSEEHQAATSLVISRQIGPDILCCSIQCQEDVASLAEVLNRTYNYDPLTRQEDRETLQRQAESMMEKTALRRGLSPEERDTVLPHTLADYPVGGSWRNGGFAIPCTELLEMKYGDGEDYFDRQITLTGETPDGSQGMYTLLNSTLWLTNDTADAAAQDKADRYHEWESVFADGEDMPDPEMSAFLGAPAVPWGDGWLLNPGPFYGEYDGQPCLYYLTVDSLS